MCGFTYKICFFNQETISVSEIIIFGKVNWESQLPDTFYQFCANFTHFLVFEIFGIICAVLFKSNITYRKTKFVVITEVAGHA